MNAQIDLFTGRTPPLVLALPSAQGEGSRLAETEDLQGSPMDTSREKASRDEAPSPLSVPRLVTTHGLLYQVDCLDLLAAVRSNSIDTIFADPPFNLKK